MSSTAAPISSTNSFFLRCCPSHHRIKSSLLTSFSAQSPLRLPRSLFVLVPPHLLPLHSLRTHSLKPRSTPLTAAASVSSMATALPPPLDATSNPPALFDGTTRLYVSYTCPFAQRVWITRNVKGLQDKIELVAIDLLNRPDWYKEKVYPPNKVPALEHNNEVKGESLDLIKYVDSQFDGPSLLPEDPAKKDLAEELLSYTDTFNKAVYGSMKGEAGEEANSVFDYIEKALSKFEDGPFFLGQFSLVDIAYAPFIERFEAILSEVKNYEITAGRPKLALWIEEINKIEGYKQTRRDPTEHVESFKRRFAA